MNTCCKAFRSIILIQTMSYSALWITVLYIGNHDKEQPEQDRRIERGIL
jgi:hypothetical protein